MNLSWLETSAELKKIELVEIHKSSEIFSPNSFFKNIFKDVDFLGSYVLSWIPVMIKMAPL